MLRKKRSDDDDEEDASVDLVIGSYSIDTSIKSNKKMGPIGFVNFKDVHEPKRKTK